MKLVTIAIFLIAASQHCYAAGGRIVGGIEIIVDESPYQASLRSYGAHICGGAIISKEYVITAAHCTFEQTAETLSVRVGSTRNYDGGDIHEVKKIKIHPYYNRATYDFDVSLLQLSKLIKIDDLTKQEISLPVYGELLPEKTPVLVSGWGELKLQVNVIQQNLEVD